MLFWTVSGNLDQIILYSGGELQPVTSSETEKRFKITRDCVPISFPAYRLPNKISSLNPKNLPVSQEQLVNIIDHVVFSYPQVIYTELNRLADLLDPFEKEGVVTLKDIKEAAKWLEFWSASPFPIRLEEVL